VRLSRLEADFEPRRDILRAEALGDQLQDLLLAEGELSEVEPNLSLARLGSGSPVGTQSATLGREEGLVFAEAVRPAEIRTRPGIALEHATRATPALPRERMSVSDSCMVRMRTSVSGRSWRICRAAPRPLSFGHV